MSTLRATVAEPVSTVRRIAAALVEHVFGRFAVVSLASLVTGHVILYGLHSVLGMAPVPSNLLSTTLNTILVFVANRTWVWNVGASMSFRREVVPFALFAVIGLGVSTLLVWITATTIGEGLWVNVANLVGFGVVWIARFFALDRLVYRNLANAGS